MKTFIRFAFAAVFALMITAPTQAGDKITYYHNDALGSPVAATNQLGQVVLRETYKPYGERTTKATASTNNSIWFTGKPEESALGINYFGARWYHPEVGRFLGFDPAGVTSENIHSFNRYGYANDNPFGFVDPDGRAPRERELEAGEGVLSGGGSSLGARVSRGGQSTISGATGGGSRIRGGSGEGFNVDPIPQASSGSSKAGRYEFPDQTAGGKPYVGQSGNIEERLSQHERAGRYQPGTETTTEVSGGKTAREISEHQRIQELTGGIPARQSDAVSNKVDPIGPARRHLLRE